ncbi:MAG TPA: hypothetical protein VGH27_13470 [Streptosporangiaceae bacterium]|jgi:hypothetical protein
MDENPMAPDTSTGEGISTGDGASTREGASTGDVPLLDAQAAAAILAEAGQHARDELRVKRPLVFACAGLAWLLGYGAIWLSVRGQHPYQGPTPPAVFALVVLVGVAVAISASLHSRAASGIGGLSEQRRRIGIAALIAGYVGVLVLEAALDHAGAGRAATFGVFAAAAPVVVTGVVYIANSAVRVDWSLLALGGWLIAAAAGAAFAGPVGVWGVMALAGAVGYLLSAVASPRLGGS